MLTHKGKAPKSFTLGPSNKPRAAVEDSAPLRMKEKQTSPPWWSDLTRIAHEKVDRLTQVVTENDPNKTYMLHIKRTGEEVLLNVNLAFRHCLDLMFSGNYADAVFEHENAHLAAPTTFSQWDPSSKPIVDVRILSLLERYRQFSGFLTEMIRDSIANAVLKSQTLQQFLEFEVRKIEDHEARSPFVVDNLLWVTEVKLCADMRHLSISDLEKNVSAILGESTVLQHIYEIAYRVFRKAWLASEEASPEVDLIIETRTLLEYVLEHTLLLLETMHA
jgi:hypothetical protein